MLEAFAIWCLPSNFGFRKSAEFLDSEPLAATIRSLIASYIYFSAPLSEDSDRRFHHSVGERRFCSGGSSHLRKLGPGKCLCTNVRPHNWRINCESYHSEWIIPYYCSVLLKWECFIKMRATCIAPSFQVICIRLLLRPFIKLLLPIAISLAYESIIGKQC